MYKKIFIVLLMLSASGYAQNYYYSGGGKIFITQKPNKYVISFNDGVTEKEVENFLSQNELSTSTKSLKYKSIIVESPRFNKEQLKTLAISNNIGKGVTSVYTNADKTFEYTISDKIIIKLKNESDLNIILKKFDLVRIEREWLGDKVYLVKVNQMNEKLTIEIANQMYESGLVKFSHPDFIGFNWPESGTNDTYYGNQWNLTKISAPDAWNISMGSSSIIIAILDGGVQSTHPDLDGHIVTGYDVVNNDNTTDPESGYHHGTACAGITAAETNNGTGIAGVGYNCRIMPIKFTLNSTDGWDNTANFVAGINWAVSHGTHIISISGFTVEADAVNNVINSATSSGRNGKGCVIVKSSGNSHGSISFPGKHPKVICVGATTQDDVRENYSSYGPELDVMAPGSTWTTKNSGYYENNSFTGTSASAPQVAGLAGLILSNNNTLTEEIVRKIICYSADDIGTSGFDNYTGWGRINAWRALDATSHTTTNGTLPRNEIWFGTINLIGNVSVPNGVKLTILSNTTLNFNSYSIVSSGGAIYVEGGGPTTYVMLKTGSIIKGIYPTIQSAVNASTSGQIVYIPGGTFNNNISISGKSNLSIVGDYYNTVISGTLTAVNCPGLSLSSFYCYRIYANNCDNSYFGNDVTSTSSEIGVSLYYCSDFIRDGYVINSGCGLQAYASDGITYSMGEFWNNYTGIASQASSDVVAVGAKLCGSINYDLTANYNSYLMAVGCYYNNATPRYREQTGGNVDIIGSSNNCSGLGKRSTNTAAEKDLLTDNSMQTDDPVLNEFRAINYSYFGLLQEINDNAKDKGKPDRAKFYDKHIQVIENFKKFVKNNPNSSLAKVALTTASHSFRRFEDYKAMKQFLMDIITDNNLVKLKDQAERLIVDYYRNIKDLDNAIKTADNIIKSNGDDKELICDALYTKGLILAHELNRQAEAAECFSNIVKNYSISSLTKLAKNELELLGNDIKKIEKEIEVVDNSKFRTSSYPNPFNPSTTIEYDLPAGTRVIIKVYDMIGREVTTLVNEEKAAGKHSVQFNASNLSSGVYFYSINAGGYYQVKKLLLVK